MWNKKTLGIVITTQQTILLQQPSAGDIVTALHHNAHNKPSLHILSLASTLLKTSLASNWQVHVSICWYCYNFYFLTRNLRHINFKNE